MVRFRIVLFSVFFASSSLCTKPDYIDVETWNMYRGSWIQDEIKLSGTHTIEAERLAKTFCNVTRAQGKKKEWSNFVAFGLSVEGTDGKNISEIFPRLLFSAYDIPDHSPTVDTTGEALIAIPDMFRGDMMHRSTQSEKVLEFFCWLASNDYTSMWNINKLISEQSMLIAGKNATKKAILPSSELSHSLLHCEQVLLYMLLKDDSLIKDLVSRLITKDGALGLLMSKDSIFTFDILTYNDMCPRCFSTCYHLQETLASSINRILFEEMRKIGKLNELSEKREFPIHVQIQISSFRPFLITDNLETRGNAEKYSYEKYFTLEPSMSCNYDKKLPIVQAFNHLISQYVFNYRVDDFINSVQKLGNGKFSDVWKLKEEFCALNGEIDQSMKNKISETLVSKKDIFTKPEVCCSILGFAIDLAYQINGHKDDYYSLVRNLVANAKVDRTQLPELIEDLKRIPENSVHILATINDQQMLINTYDFLDKSVPVEGRYNFESMASAAENIALTNVHQQIQNFIINKVGEVYKNIKHINLPYKLANALKKLKAF